jgi:hypothetical protein
MACAAIVRLCMLRNSYITVAISPGCTCTERSAGLKSQGPRALASNSMVIVRVRSICVLPVVATVRCLLKSPSSQLPLRLFWSDRLSTFTPRASQMARYSGTSA